MAFKDIAKKAKGKAKGGNPFAEKGDMEEQDGKNPAPKGGKKGGFKAAVKNAKKKCKGKKC